LDLQVTIRLDRWTDLAAKYIYFPKTRGCHEYPMEFKDKLECLSLPMILNMMR
jgi:hypothetical protein